MKRLSTVWRGIKHRPQALLAVSIVVSCLGSTASAAPLREVEQLPSKTVLNATVTARTPALVLVRGTAGVPRSAAGVLVRLDARSSTSVSWWLGPAGIPQSAPTLTTRGATISTAALVPFDATGRLRLRSNGRGSVRITVIGWVRQGDIRMRLKPEVVVAIGGRVFNRRVTLVPSRRVPARSGTVVVRIVAQAGSSPAQIYVDGASRSSQPVITLPPRGRASTMAVVKVDGTAPLSVRSSARIVGAQVSVLASSQAFARLTPSRGVPQSIAAPAGRIVAVKVAGRDGIPRIGAGTAFLRVSSSRTTSLQIGSSSKTLSGAYLAARSPSLMIASIASDGKIRLRAARGTRIQVTAVGWASTRLADSSASAGSERIVPKPNTVQIAAAQVLAMTGSSTEGGTLKLAAAAPVVRIDGYVWMRPSTRFVEGLLGRVEQVVPGKDGQVTVAFVPGVVEAAFSEFSVHERLAPKSTMLLQQRVGRTGWKTVGDLSGGKTIMMSGDRGLMSLASGRLLSCRTKSGTVIDTGSSFTVDFNLRNVGGWVWTNRFPPKASAGFWGDLVIGVHTSVSTGIQCKLANPGALRIVIPMSVGTIEATPVLEAGISGGATADAKVVVHFKRGIHVNDGNAVEADTSITERSFEANGAITANARAGVDIAAKLFGVAGIAVTIGPEVTLAANFDFIARRACLNAQAAVRGSWSATVGMWFIQQRWELGSFGLGPWTIVDRCRATTIAEQPPAGTSAPPVPTPIAAPSGGGFTPPSGALSFGVSPQSCREDVCTPSSPQRGVMSGFTPNARVSITIYDPSGAACNCVYTRSAATNGAGNFTFIWYHSAGEPFGTYRALIGDLATGRTVSAAFTVLQKQTVTPPAPQPQGNGTVLIPVQNTVIWSVPPGYHEDSVPAPVISTPLSPRGATPLAQFNSGAQLTAYCWTTGGRQTDGNDSWTGDDTWQFSSSLWYGVRLADGRSGFISATWTTKREDKLGLADCNAPPAQIWREQVWSSTGVGSFLNYHNASGPGPRLASQQWVDVSCKVYDTTIASALPGGYWYRIASSPWNNQYYATANSFWNGDPPGGPYTHSYDAAVPNC